MPAANTLPSTSTTTKLSPDHYRSFTVHTIIGCEPFTEITDTEFKGGRVYIRTRYNSIVADVVYEVSLGRGEGGDHVAEIRQCCENAVANATK